MYARTSAVLLVYWAMNWQGRAGPRQAWG